MVRKEYIEKIKKEENLETQNIIGRIDLEVLKSEKPESLYYTLPLIERLVLEIYKLEPKADIEHYEQGIMRTICSCIDKNNRLGIIPEKVIVLIKKYFEDKDDRTLCVRNYLFHAMNIEKKITVSFDEINYIIMELLIILNIKINENTNFNFEKITYLE